MRCDSMMIKLLLIEDDNTFALMLKTWLSGKGFLVDHVTSIAEARKQLRIEKYSIILSDLRLPDNDGISLLPFLKEHRVTSPIIIMTGYADINTAVQAIKLGAFDYIEKPVKRAELEKKLHEAIALSVRPTNETQLSPLRDEKTEKELIKEALFQAGNNKSKAADLLKIDRKTLYNKLKQYNI